MPHRLFLPVMVVTYACTLLILPDLAWAQALDPVQGVADMFVEFLTGAFATSIAVIGLAVCGFMAMMGRLPWGAALAVIAGIILVFGAANLVEEISGFAEG